MNRYFEIVNKFTLFLFLILVENPAESCHPFRFMVASDSGRKLPPIPV